MFQTSKKKWPKKTSFQSQENSTILFGQIKWNKANKTNAFLLINSVLFVVAVVVVVVVVVLQVWWISLDRILGIFPGVCSHKYLSFIQIYRAHLKCSSFLQKYTKHQTHLFCVIITAETKRKSSILLYSTDQKYSMTYSYVSEAFICI